MASQSGQVVPRADFAEEWLSSRERGHSRPQPGVNFRAEPS